jgi:hypothetical protein
MMEAASTSETSVNFYQTIRRYNPEDSHLLILKRSNDSMLRFVLLGFWRRRVDSYIDNNVSEKHTVSIFRAEDGLQTSAWRWIQYVYPKRWHLPTSLHGAKTQKNSAIIYEINQLASFIFTYLKLGERISLGKGTLLNTPSGPWTQYCRGGMKYGGIQRKRCILHKCKYDLLQSEFSKEHVIRRPHTLLPFWCNQKKSDVICQSLCSMQMDVTSSESTRRRRREM